jgi:hypothetical protein
MEGTPAPWRVFNCKQDSPPSPMPWPKRQRANSKGAVIPMAAYRGRAPIRNMDRPIVERARTSVVFRPMRSPNWPNSAEPMGRAMKAIAKVASDASVEGAESVAGKKRRLVEGFECRGLPGGDGRLIVTTPCHAAEACLQTYPSS